MKKSGLKVSFYLKKSEMSEDGLCPVMGHINSKSSHDITPKAIESLLEFLRIGYNGKNRTHVLHQSQ